MSLGGRAGCVGSEEERICFMAGFGPTMLHSGGTIRLKGSAVTVRENTGTIVTNINIIINIIIINHTFNEHKTHSYNAKMQTLVS